MTEQQLSEALTARAVAERTLMEALLNRVVSLIASEQVARLGQSEQIAEVRADLAALRAEQQTFHSAVLRLLDRLEGGV